MCPGTGTFSKRVFQTFNARVALDQRGFEFLVELLGGLKLRHQWRIAFVFRRDFVIEAIHDHIVVALAVTFDHFQFRGEVFEFTCRAAQFFFFCIMGALQPGGAFVEVLEINLESTDLCFTIAHDGFELRD